MVDRHGAGAGRLVTRLLLALLAAVSSAILPVSPAQAAFPGANGPIVYHCVPNASSDGDLCRLDPDTLAVTVIFDGSFPVHEERVGVSADGSLVAFSQVFGIFIRRVDGSPVPVVPSGPLGRPGDGDVSFTPDGASIVYRCSGSGLCRTPVSGGLRTPIPGTVEGDTKPEVSPNGTRVAFVNGGTLFTIPLAGGARTPLTSGLVNDQVSWSPDGSRIAFVAGAGLCPVAGIATIPAVGGPVICLPNGQGATDPSFSPDGTQIFAAANGRAVFLGANGVGRREVAGVTGVEENDWPPRRAGNARCTALFRELDRTTNPRARQIIERYLSASGC